MIIHPGLGLLGLLALSWLPGAGGGDLHEGGIGEGRMFIVGGVSMQPALNPGDRVQLKPGKARGYRRGDLVAIRFRTRTHLFVKRILAVAGDDVRWHKGRITVNGNAPAITDWPAERKVSLRNWKLLGIQLSRYGNRVPEGNIIIMGDNVSKSLDSGDFGMVSTDQIAGHIDQ